MANNIDRTMAFNSDDFKQKNICDTLRLVDEALKEKGYNSVDQIAGYLVSNDPAYISSHNGARTKIQSIDRYEIIEELVRYYINTKK